MPDLSRVPIEDVECACGLNRATCARMQAADTCDQDLTPEDLDFSDMTTDPGEMDGDHETGLASVYGDNE